MPKAIEKPILFSPVMARQVRVGEKTQTRRVVTPRPELIERVANLDIWLWQAGRGMIVHADENTFREFVRKSAPYQVGDRLWVREAWRERTGLIEYAADDPAIATVATGYKPSMFMPRAHCRTWLEVISVRAERVQEISEEDAAAEGVQQEFSMSVAVPGQADYSIPVSYRGGFCNLWNALNKGRGFGWGFNPWVFAYEFRRLP